MNLLELKINETGIIETVSVDEKNSQRLAEMGIIPGNTISLIKYAPMGDPVEFFINGYTLSLRKNDASNVSVRLIDSRKSDSDILITDSKHPGIGENGIFHNHKKEKPLNKDEQIKFALLGNPNCGKTTVFNAITGSNQHIGNFPGVTVDIKEGKLLKYKNSSIVDLPGIYSLTPYSNEESITTSFLINNKINGIINIIDINSIERGLFLTHQLLELGIPMVLGLNMYDEFKKQHGYININALEDRIGIPVIPISAANNQGIDELIEHANHVAYYQEKPLIIEKEIEDNNYKIIKNTICSIEHLLEDSIDKSKYTTTFIATKCLENNEIVLDQINLSDNAVYTISHIKEKMEEEVKLPSATAISSYRYIRISHDLKNIIKKDNQYESNISLKIDNILTGRFTAIPCFIIIMMLVFFLTFNLIGPSLQNIIQKLIDGIAKSLLIIFIKGDVSPFVQSLVTNGIIGGLGTIVSFVPTVLCLFLFVSILEDTGYISRIAFIMDKPLRKIGLSGRTIIPLLLGFGCTVPAVLSTRTLTSKKDRRRTITLLPFISCSAKLPIYGFFSNLFFKDNAGLIVAILYFAGIVLAILISFILNKIAHGSQTVPFIMELPPYRFPKIKNVLINLWQKAKDYLQKTFSIILVATIVIWLLSSIDYTFAFTEEQSKSLLALLSGTVAPIFKPLGFGNWQSVISLISGFMAKETVVSTLNVLIGTKNIALFFTKASAISYMSFCLLYTPCIAAISSIKSELGTKDAIILVVYQCVIAWIISFIVYQIAIIL